MSKEIAHAAEIERHAYNAAFYDLGLRWHWDSATYHALMSRSPCSRQRIGLYLEDEQAHLLRAYEADFLIDAIEDRKARHACRSVPASLDWATIHGGEIGA